MEQEKRPLINQARSLDELLSIASHEELSAIADIITDRGDGRLALDEAIKREILDHQSKRTLAKIAHLLSREIRAFGSNSFANIARGGEPIQYHEVVLDVANKLGIKVLDNSAATVEVELMIINGLLAKSLNGKTSAEVIKMLRDSGSLLDSQIQNLITAATNEKSLIQLLSTSFGTLSLAKIVSAALTPTIAAGGAVFLSASVVARAPAMFNPLGMAIAAAWASYDMSGPAFRVTIPAIAHIAFIRQTQITFEVERARMELKKCL